MRVLVATGKGGSSKTTTAIHLAAILAETEPPVRLVDLDHKQLLATQWIELAREDQQPWAEQIEVISSTGRNLHRELVNWTGSVVVDSAGGDFQVLAQAARAVDLLLAIVRPTRMELAALGDTATMVDGLVAAQPGLRGCYLIAQSRGSTSAAREVPDALREGGYRVLRNVIPLSENIAQSFGSAPNTHSYYRHVYEELRTL